MKQKFQLYILLGTIASIIAINEPQHNISCTDHSVNFCKLYNFNIEEKTELPLRHSPHIYDLIIRHSFIPEIPKRFFIKLPNLLMLIMNQCNLSKISTLDFVHFKKLETLILSYNALTEVPNGMFKENTNLTRLYLGYNNISVLHAESFLHIANLSYLDLQHNQIEHVIHFHGLIHLEYIDLSYNKIKVIDNLAFASSTFLRTILLNNNQISHVSAAFLRFFLYLNLLDVSFNPKIEELTISYIDTLIATNCKIKLCRIKRVTKLNVAFNQLRYLDIEDKLSVREMFLHDNQFETMEDFADMLNLAWLDLSNNQLSQISTRFDSNYLELPSLTYLNFANNNLMHKIDRIAPNLLPLQKLNFLDLTGSNLTSNDKEDIWNILPNLKTFVADDLKEFLENQKQKHNLHWPTDRKFLLLCILILLSIAILVVVIYRFYSGFRICPLSTRLNGQGNAVPLDGNDVTSFE